MAKEKKSVAATPTTNRVEAQASKIISILKSIDSHLASLVYEATPSRGFGAGIEKAIAQPFIDENKKNYLETIIREEVKKALGDK